MSRNMMNRKTMNVMNVDVAEDAHDDVKDDDEVQEPRPRRWSTWIRQPFCQPLKKLSEWGEGWSKMAKERFTTRMLFNVKQTFFWQTCTNKRLKELENETLRHRQRHPKAGFLTWALPLYSQSGSTIFSGDLQVWVSENRDEPYHHVEKCLILNDF